MTFKVNNKNKIVSTTSGTEIIGSQVLDALRILGFVVIKRERGSRSAKYGIYLGTIGEESNAIVRTFSGDEPVAIANLIPIIPSERLIMHFINKLKSLFQNISGNFESYPYKTFIMFMYDFVKLNFPDKVQLLEIPVCAHCGKPFPFYNINGVLCCEECYNELYTNCRRCGISVLRSETRHGHCLSCHRHHWITPYHRDQPDLKFYGDNHDNTVPFFGVELEVAYGGAKDSTVAEILPLINTDEEIFMYCSSDSSIEDGFENITQPATLEYHLGLYDNYNAVFKKLREMDYLSHDTTCCGLHVHFNRDFFEDNEEEYIAKMLYIFEKFWDEVFIFSRRVKAKMGYSGRIDMNIQTFIRESNKSRDHHYHYYAINLANINTIEFRIFRGTLNIETFFASLELVSNFVNFARYKSTNELHSMKFEDMLTTPRLQSYWKRITSVDREM